MDLASGIYWSAVDQNLPDTLALLARIPPTLDALLRDLPDSWARANEGEATFSAFDVVGHLANAERTNWMPRLRMILEYGETRAFEPFSRFAQIKQNQGKTMGQVLDEFAELRAKSLEELRGLNLGAADLARRGGHPALGVVTLHQLLAAWATHDLTHLHQISRVLALQYCDAVGPWGRYLGVLHCNGHGES